MCIRDRGTTVNFDSSDHCHIRFPVEMRAEPSLVVSDYSNAFRIYGNGGGRNVDNLGTNTGVNTLQSMQLYSGGGTSGNVGFVRKYSANNGVYATIAASAEL